jgi:hypothetical protein
MGRLSVRVLVVIALVAAMAVTVQGCQMIAQKAVEQATGVKVDKNGDQVTITGKDGTTASVGKGTVPDGWPTDVPVYAGTITMGNKMDANGKTAFLVTLETPDAPKAVADWYQEKLTGDGWTKTDRNDASAGGKEVSILVAEKGTQRVAVSATTGNGKTIVTVNVGDKN